MVSGDLTVEEATGAVAGKRVVPPPLGDEQLPAKRNRAGKK